VKKLLLWGLFALLLAAFAALQFIPGGTSKEATTTQVPAKAAGEAKNLGATGAKQ